MLLNVSLTSFAGGGHKNDIIVASCDTNQTQKQANDKCFCEESPKKPTVNKEKFFLVRIRDNNRGSYNNLEDE